MCPADSFNEATADMINDGAGDLLQQFSKIYYEKDETKKVMPELMYVSVPIVFVRLYSRLQNTLKPLLSGHPLLSGY